MTSFVKKTHEKDDVGIATFDLIGLLCTNNIAYIIILRNNGIPELVSKLSMLTVK